MTSRVRGRAIPDVEVTNVSGEGFWIFLDDRERFLSFGDFPWFRDASIATLCNIERPGPGHLHWPDLEVDLTIESLDHPERFASVRDLKAAPRGSRKRMQPGRANPPEKPSKRRARG
jgi:uncharacterized protein DUF2442